MLFLWFFFTLLPLWCLLLFVSLFFSWYNTWSAVVSECKTLSRESLNSPRKHFPWFHGPCIASQTGISTLTYLRYLCVCCQLCWCICREEDLLLYFLCCCSLWPRTHDHKERVPAETRGGCAPSTCCCWRENYCLCESVPKWLTAHSCVHFCNWDVM